MPAGTLSISKTGTKPETYRVMFVEYASPNMPPQRSITLNGADALRPFLASIGIVGRAQDEAVRDAIQTSVATIANVHLSQQLIDQHGLGSWGAPMTMVSVRCPVVDCTGVVRLDKSMYDDSAEKELVNVRCPLGHTFDYQKGTCPRCQSALDEGEWRPQQAWSGEGPPPGDAPVWHHAQCTNPSCDYEGPKEP